MQFCFDLHIHTCFSDGNARLNDVLDYCSELDAVSITDHNNLNAYIRLTDQLGKQLHNHCRFLPGIELRLPGLPDYLVYFPHVVDRQKLLEIQKWGERIDELDQVVTLYVAQKMLPDEDIPFLWRCSDPCATCTKRFFGTMQLAKLLTRNSQSHDWRKIIPIVRNAKSDIFRDPPKELSSIVEELFALATPKAVVAKAKEENGKVVFAHPLRELVRANNDKLPLDEKPIVDGLQRLGNDFLNDDITCVEHIIFYSGNWWKEHFTVAPYKAEDIFFKWASDLRINMTVGTDAHDLGETERHKYVDALRRVPDNFYSLAPKWLLNFLESKS